jgi:hypothetical protein
MAISFSISSNPPRRLVSHLACNLWWDSCSACYSARSTLGVATRRRVGHSSSASVSLRGDTSRPSTSSSSSGAVRRPLRLLRGSSCCSDSSISLSSWLGRIANLPGLVRSEGCYSGGENLQRRGSRKSMHFFDQQHPSGSNMLFLNHNE